MKSGISQWALPVSFKTQTAIELAGKAGFQSLELCVGEGETLPIDSTEKDIADVLRCAEKAGVELLSVATGLGWKYPLSSPDPKVREDGKEALKRTMQIAHWAGIDSVLAVPGVVTPEVRYDVALENSLASIQDLIPTAEKLGVCIAVENVWNKLLLSPTEMRDFVDQFESEYVGAFFDVGNILLYGYPEHWISILGSRIRKIHVKDFKTNVGNLDGFVMLLEGEVNWPAVMRALREIGYEGPVTAEYFPYTHAPETALRHCKSSLDAILAL